MLFLERPFFGRICFIFVARARARLLVPYFLLFTIKTFAIIFMIIIFMIITITTTNLFLCPLYLQITLIPGSLSLPSNFRTFIVVVICFRFVQHLLNSKIIIFSFAFLLSSLFVWPICPSLAARITTKKWVFKALFFLRFSCSTYLSFSSSSSFFIFFLFFSSVPLRSAFQSAFYGRFLWLVSIPKLPSVHANGLHILLNFWIWSRYARPLWKDLVQNFINHLRLTTSFLTFLSIINLITRQFDFFHFLIGFSYYSAS